MNARERQFHFRALLSRCPPLYAALLTATRSPRRDLLARAGRSIVIDGFPRSGNTYAVCALLAAGQPGNSIARHIHLPLQFRLAHRYGIPSLLLIRDPVDAVVSWLIREPRLSMAFALQSYISFYSGVEPYRNSVVIGRFEDLIQSPFGVFRAVNSRFDASLPTPELTEELQADIMSRVDELDRIEQGGTQRAKQTRARPDAGRDALKPELRERILDRHTSLVDEAGGVHKAWTSAVDRTEGITEG